MVQTKNTKLKVAKKPRHYNTRNRFKKSVGNQAQLLMIRQFNEELTRIQAEVIMVQEEKKELRKQLKAEKLPSPTSSKEKDHNLKELIKTLAAKNRKAKIPEPHKLDRNNKQLNTFHQECTTWLNDKREYLTDRCITLITGYMMGTTSKWFTMISEAASLKNEHWATTEAFWKQ